MLFVTVAELLRPMAIQTITKNFVTSIYLGFTGAIAKTNGISNNDSSMINTSGLLLLSSFLNPEKATNILSHKNAPVI